MEKNFQNSGCLWQAAQRLTRKGHEGTLLGDDLYLDKSLSYTGVYICQTLIDVHLMFVHFAGSKFCLKYCKQISNFNDMYAWAFEVYWFTQLIF